MSKWIKVGDVESFNEEVRVFVYQGNPIAVFHLEDGFYAIDDTCSHEEESLSEGEIMGCEIECPAHGARFDIKTGKNLSFPAVIPVKSYPVKVENGQIFIEVNDQ